MYIAITFCTAAQAVSASIVSVVALGAGVENFITLKAGRIDATEVADLAS
jgi:hypothetical protein